MNFFSNLRKLFTRNLPAEPGRDEIEIVIYGFKVKFIRKISIPVPHEVSVFVPRLEFTHKITQGDRTAESSVILNSLTIVSSPLRESSGKPAGNVQKPVRLPVKIQ